MKKFLVGLLCTMMLAGCGTASSSTASAGASSGADTAGGAASAPTVVRTAVSSEPDSLDPFKSAASDTEAIMHNVFDGLVLYDETGAIIPGLAESWEISEDGLTYTYHLVQNAEFHNGQPVTSKDCVYTYNQLSGLIGGGEAISSKFNGIVSLDAPDDYTFVITLDKPNASFLELTKFPILPEGYTDQASNPIGAGPYKFKEYTPGQRIVLERNDDYYNKDRMPKIETVEVYIMTDDSTIVQALKSNQLDYAGVMGEDVDVLQNDFDIYQNPQNMVCLLALNNSVEPLNNKEVRQAITYAINKQDIIDGAFGGFGTPLYTNFSPVMAAYYNQDVEKGYEYNADKAKELMKDAGYENGFTMTLTVPSNYQNHVNTAQIIKEELKAINIDVEINPVEWAVWLDDVYTNAKYESTVIGLTGKLDPSDVLGRYASDYPKNFFKYSNPDYDKLVAEAQVETDEAKRAELYKQCQQILTDDAAAVWTCDPNLITACRKDLKGFKAYPVTFKDFSSLYYEE